VEDEEVALTGERRKSSKTGRKQGRRKQKSNVQRWDEETGRRVLLADGRKDFVRFVDDEAAVPTIYVIT